MADAHAGAIGGAITGHGAQVCRPQVDASRVFIGVVGAGRAEGAGGVRAEVGSEAVKGGKVGRVVGRDKLAAVQVFNAWDGGAEGCGREGMEGFGRDAHGTAAFELGGLLC